MTWTVDLHARARRTTGQRSVQMSGRCRSAAVSGPAGMERLKDAFLCRRSVTLVHCRRDRQNNLKQFVIPYQFSRFHSDPPPHAPLTTLPPAPRGLCGYIWVP